MPPELPSVIPRLAFNTIGVPDVPLVLRNSPPFIVIEAVVIELGIAPKLPSALNDKVPPLMVVDPP